MEFLKHEVNLFQTEPELGIRRAATAYMANPIYQEERDEVTRQRLLFCAILCDQFEVLFNGNTSERSTLWEEVRKFMVEQGTVTLLDKDWKYVASCYWQNIRKESIRRMAKMQVGAIKIARPAQLELDRLVSEVINKRGPASTPLDQLVRNYGRNYTDEESPPAQSAQTEQASSAEVIVVVRQNEEDGQQQVANGTSSAVSQQDAATPQDQLIRSVSLKIANHHHHQHAPPNQPVPLHPPSIPHSLPSASSHSTLLAASSKAEQHQEGGGGGGANISSQLGKMVARTHSQLANGGFVEMASDFEHQLNQLVNNYKAWMFDQFYQQQEEKRAGTGEGPKAKKAKH